MFSWRNKKNINTFGLSKALCMNAQADLNAHWAPVSEGTVCDFVARISLRMLSHYVISEDHVTSLNLTEFISKHGNTIRKNLKKRNCSF